MTETRMKRAHAGYGHLRGAKPHNIKAEEVTKLFQVWGIIGKRRQRVKLNRLPFFDRGPGIEVK